METVKVVWYEVSYGYTALIEIFAIFWPTDKIWFIITDIESMIIPYAASEIENVLWNATGCPYLFDNSIIRYSNVLDSVYKLEP